VLTSTFVHLKGIGPSTERRLWEDGISDWSAFLSRPALTGISPPRKDLYDRDLTAAVSALERGNSRYFAQSLKSKDHWRLFEAFRNRALYLDIETTGLPAHEGDVTVVGLYRNGRMNTLLSGETLCGERLQDELDQADLLVTFFGRAFDVPYLQAKFPLVRFTLPHFDLCFAARRLGLQGGLKHIERELNIGRDPDLAHYDGWDAVRLWSQWMAGDAAALDHLIRYNAADTRNLEELSERLYSGMIRRYGPAPPRHPVT
jgi:uncharacterized protein YprB with RNaseH-like and TPR domain